MERNATTAGAVAPAITYDTTQPLILTPEVISAWRAAGRYGMSGTDLQALDRLLAIAKKHRMIWIEVRGNSPCEGGAA